MYKPFTHTFAVRYLHEKKYKLKFFSLSKVSAINAKEVAKGKQVSTFLSNKGTEQLYWKIGWNKKTAKTNTTKNDVNDRMVIGACKKEMDRGSVRGRESRTIWQTSVNFLLIERGGDQDLHSFISLLKGLQTQRGKEETHLKSFLGIDILVRKKRFSCSFTLQKLPYKHFE